MNFLSLLALLNTLSGYRLPFHSATGRGAYQNVIKLMLGLYISSTDENGAAGTGALSAQGLTRLTAQTVAEILQVSLHEESAHESIPGLVVGLKGGPVNEAVELIVRLCNETGERLAQSGYPDLGALVLEILKEAESVRKEGGEEAAADLFIEKVSVSHFLKDRQ